MNKCEKLPEEAWECYKTLRSTIEKYSRMKSHLEFNEECIRRKIIPKGLKMKQKINFKERRITDKCSDIIKKAEGDIMEEYVRWLEEKVVSLEELGRSAEETLSEKCEEAQLDRVIQQLTTEKERKEKKCKEEKEKKLCRLVEEQEKEDDEEVENEENRIQGDKGRKDKRKELSDDKKGNRRKRRRNIRRKKKLKRREKRRLKREREEQEFRRILDASKEIHLPEDMYDVMDNTDYGWSDAEKEVCKLGLKFVPTVKVSIAQRNSMTLKDLRII